MSCWAGCNLHMWVGGWKFPPIVSYEGLLRAGMIPVYGPTPLRTLFTSWCSLHIPRTALLPLTVPLLLLQGLWFYILPEKGHYEIFTVMLSGIKIINLKGTSVQCELIVSRLYYYYYTTDRYNNSAESFIRTLWSRNRQYYVSFFCNEVHMTEWSHRWPRARSFRLSSPSFTWSFMSFRCDKRYRALAQNSYSQLNPRNIGPIIVDKAFSRWASVWQSMTWTLKNIKRGMEELSETAEERRETHIWDARQRPTHNVNQ